MPIYWGRLFKDLDDSEVGILIKYVFAMIDFDTFSLGDQAIQTRKILTSVSDDAVKVSDILLEDIRYQKTHPHSYKKPEEKQAIRNSREYRAWRSAVFERDHYTCQNCSKVGGRLNAHHIKSFARHPELRFDTINGITLCTECHKKAHKRGFKYAE
jgi:hypothetical protein